MVNAEENLAEYVNESSKDLIYFEVRLLALRKLAYKQLSQGNIVGHETKARADELAYSFSKMTEIDLEDEVEKLFAMIRSATGKQERAENVYTEASTGSILRARGVPEKIIEKIARMYAEDLQAAYERGKCGSQSQEN